MANLYSVFKGLLPERPLLVGTVTSTYLGTHTITLIDGGVVAARGVATVGQQVFVRDGVVEGLAPALPQALIEI